MSLSALNTSLSASKGNFDASDFIVTQLSILNIKSQRIAEGTGEMVQQLNRLNEVSDKILEALVSNLDDLETRLESKTAAASGSFIPNDTAIGPSAAGAGGGAASSLISGALGGIGAGMLSRAGAARALGFASKGLVAGVGYFAAEELGDFLTEVTGSQTLGDVSEWTAKGVSIGYMFGPTGMLVGAVAGFGIGLGLSLQRYIDGETAKAQENIDNLMTASSAAIEAGNVNLVSRQLQMALDDMMYANQNYGSDDPRTLENTRLFNERLAQAEASNVAGMAEMAAGMREAAKLRTTRITTVDSRDNAGIINTGDGLQTSQMLGETAEEHQARVQSVAESIANGAISNAQTAINMNPNQDPNEIIDQAIRDSIQNHRNNNMLEALGGDVQDLARQMVKDYFGPIANINPNLAAEDAAMAVPFGNNYVDIQTQLGNLRNRLESMGAIENGAFVKPDGPLGDRAQELYNQANALYRQSMSDEAIMQLPVGLRQGAGSLLSAESGSGNVVIVQGGSQPAPAPIVNVEAPKVPMGDTIDNRFNRMYRGIPGGGMYGYTR